VGYFLVFASSTGLSRVTSTNADGRNTIWLVALRMFDANPILGVGTGNFPNAARLYLIRPGLTQSGYLIITTPKPAHNVYLEIAATLGIPGLILLIAVFGGGVIVALRAAHIFERIGDGELEVLSRCTVLALIAYLASDFFLPDLQIKQFWLLFALGLAVYKLARTESGASPVSGVSV
jgi:putative inorganic carbon (HCO3(-)) transporter